MVSESDAEDVGFVSEAELFSAGAADFRTVSITDIVSGTITVPSTEYLKDYDDPIQEGDIVVITGNAAAGTYTVDTVPTLDTFTVVEAIVDAVGGSVAFRHPAGASRVGIDPANVQGVASDKLQTALETAVGKVAVSPNDTTIGRLITKLVQGANILITENNDGGDETLTIEVVDLPPGVPAELNFEESEGLSGTASAVYQEKLTVALTGLPLGNYMLLFQWVVTGTSNNTRVETRIQLDNTTDILEVDSRIQTANSEWSIGSHKVLQGLSGDHDIDVDWRKSAGSGTAQIKWARVAVYLLEDLTP